MGRGRKPNSIKKMDYITVFFNSVGSYVQRINDYLSRQINPEPLSNHIRIAGGFAFKSTDYLEEGVPVIRISDFSDEKIVLENVKFYKESESLKKYELESGDIIIALTGGTIAKLGIVQEGLGKLYLNQRVGKFEVLNPSEFESEYVYWIARSVQTTIKELAWGAAIPNVSPKQIEKIKFPIPDRKVQSGIVMFLNDLRKNNIVVGKCYFHAETESEILFMHQSSLHSAGIVTELTYQQTLLKKLRQQILQEAVEGKLTADWRERNPDVEPASELLARIQAEKAQLIKDKKIKKQKPLPPISEEEKPFELPDGWVWCRINDISNVGTGATPLTSEPSYYGGEIHWMTSGDTSFDYVTHTKAKITEKAIQETNCQVYPSGTLVVAMYGQGKTRGQVTELKIDAATNQACVVIQLYLFSIEANQFLKTHFKKIYNEIRELAQGGAQPNLNMGKIKANVVPFPPLPEQKAIVAKVEKLLALCEQLETQITDNQHHAEQLMQAVLKEVFSQA